LVEKNDGKQPPGKSRCRWVDNIMWGLPEWENMNWIFLAEERDQ
jgi:hypothetical protein